MSQVAGLHMLDGMFLLFTQTNAGLHKVLPLGEGCPCGSVADA